MMCVSAIMVMVFIKFLSLLRLLLGPLSETLCWFQIFFNQSVAVTIMLVLNTTYLARVNLFDIRQFGKSSSSSFSIFMLLYTRQQLFAMRTS